MPLLEPLKRPSANVWPALIQTYERGIQMGISAETKTSSSTFSKYVEEWNLRQADIAAYVGGSGRANELFKGTRKLSPKLMLTLHEAYGMLYEHLMKFSSGQPGIYRG